MPREVRLSPVAMTMSGLACSMASSSGPGFGEAHRKRDVGDGDGDVLQQFFGDRLRLRRIGPLLGYRRRHEHGRIDVDAFVGRETGDDDVDLLHGFQCTW